MFALWKVLTLIHLPGFTGKVEFKFPRNKTFYFCVSLSVSVRVKERFEGKVKGTIWGETGHIFVYSEDVLKFIDVMKLCVSTL